MSRGRAFRRTMRLVLQKRRRHYWGRSDAPGSDCPPTPWMLGRVVDTPTPCSCHVCRSPRKTFKSPGWKFTHQERRAYTASGGSTYIFDWRHL